MNNNIDVKSAAAQFTKASLDLAYATLQYPFKGSWKRLVIAGPAVLLLASGAGALVYSVTMGIFRGVLGGIYKGSQSVYKTFFNSRSSRRMQPPPLRPFNEPSSIPQPLADRAQPAAAAPVQILPPPPEEVAKMRNVALLKLLPLIEKYALDPLMEKKDLIKGISCTEENLKQWLKSMTLCLLGFTWDKLETSYVQFNNPPIETVDSIIAQVRKMNAAMGDVFEQHKTAQSHKEIWKFIEESDLAKQDKLTLSGFYLSLDAILTQSGEEVEERDVKIQLNRAIFAKKLSAISHSLKYFTKAAEILIEDLKKEPEPAATPDVPAAASPQTPPVENPFSMRVAEVEKTLTSELTTKYLLPLGNIKSEQWNDAVVEEVREESRALCLEYIHGRVSEKNFFENVQSFGLSTSLTSKICFLRAVQTMGNDQEALRQSTQAIMKSIFAQLQPTISEAIKRSSDAISQIPLQKAVPQVMDQVIQVLNCCKILQGLYMNPGELEDSVSYSSPDNVNNNNNVNADDFVVAGPSLCESLIGALHQVKGDEFDYVGLREIFSTLKPHHSGKKIVENLKKSDIPIHPIVWDSFVTHQWERNWIQGTKEKLKAVFSIYADRDSELVDWVSGFFKDNLEAQESNLVSKLFSIPAKLQAYPVIKLIMTWLFKGMGADFESRGVDLAQQTLNEFTSTGELSTLIGVQVVKSLITKDEEKWRKNLPVLKEAYQYLHPDEQKIILKHLAVIHPDFDTTIIIRNAVPEEISQLHQREENCRLMMNQMLQVLSPLERNKKEYTIIELGIQKIKREHELQKFERIRVLVTTVTEKTLDLPDELKKIITKTILEAMPLLTCQELIKHWIFSVVDLLVKELEATTRSKENADNHDSFTETTLTQLISLDRQSAFLSSLTSLVKSDNLSLTGAAINGVSGIARFLRQVTYSADKVIWNQFSKYVDAKISPDMIADKAVSQLLEYGKDPHGLSDTIIDALKEHVADPRKPENRE